MGSSRPAPPKMPTYVWNWCFHNNYVFCSESKFRFNIFFPFDNFFQNKLLHHHVDINIILTRITSTSSIFMYFDIQRIGRTCTYPLTCLTWVSDDNCVTFIMGDVAKRRRRRKNILYNRFTHVRDCWSVQTPVPDATRSFVTLYHT